MIFGKEYLYWMFAPNKICDLQILLGVTLVLKPTKEEV